MYASCLLQVKFSVFLRLSVLQAVPYFFARRLRERCEEPSFRSNGDSRSSTVVESHLGYLAKRICQEGFSVRCDADNILLLSSVLNVRMSFPGAVEIAMLLCALEQTELEYM